MAFLKDISTGKPMRKCVGECKRYKFLEEFESPRMRTCIMCRAKHSFVVCNAGALSSDDTNERARARRAYKAMLAGNTNYKPRGPRMGSPQWTTQEGHNMMQRKRYREKRAALGKTVRGSEA